MRISKSIPGGFLILVLLGILAANVLGQSPVCTYTFSAGGFSFPAAGGTASLSITPSSNTCSWSVSGISSWIAFTSAVSGTGPGVVTFQVGANSGGDLSGSFVIAGTTFIVEQQAATLQNLSFIGSMPHVAAEGGWHTSFTLVNKGTTSSTARLNTFLDSVPQSPVLITLPQQPSLGPIQGLSLDQTIAPNASFLVQESGSASVPWVVGSAQLSATTPSVDGFAIFHFDPSQQEAVVPLTLGAAGSYILAFDNTNGVATGVAVASVSTLTSSIPVIIRDDQGNQLVTDFLQLPANGHTSYVLAQQYPATANVRGTIEFDAPSGAQISALGIRYTPPGTLTTIPSLSNVGTNGGYMAYLTSAAGWQTTFVLVNTGTASASATLSFFDPTGKPLSLPLTYLQSGANTTATSLTQTLAARASLWVLTTGPSGAPLLTGSVQLTTNGNVSGYEIFRDTVTGQEAVVPIETRADSKGYILAFDNTNGTATGVAVSIASQFANEVPVVVRDDQGNLLVTGTGFVGLQANGETAFNMASTFPSTANIRGTIEFDLPPNSPAGTGISVLGIRIPQSLTLTTLPPLAK